MIANRARLAFKVAAIGCLVVGFTLLVGGLLATVDPLARDFAQINNSLPPASGADSRIQAGLKLTIASQILLAIAALAGVGWAGCSLFVRYAERAGRMNDEPGVPANNNVGPDLPRHPSTAFPAQRSKP